jgi:hypothetical protein
MRAISIQQPWAWAILHAGKDIENRTWPTKVRGRVQIHAGKKIDKDGLQFLRLVGIEPPSGLPTGAFVGEVTIADCCEDCEVAGDSEKWAFGPWCFLLEKPAAYAEPIPGRGMLGFFESGNSGSVVE